MPTWTGLDKKETKNLKNQAKNHQWDSTTNKRAVLCWKQGEFKKKGRHSGQDFVQILNMGGAYWITVSNVGCDKDSETYMTLCTKTLHQPTRTSCSNSWLTYFNRQDK